MYTLTWQQQKGKFSENGIKMYFDQPHRKALGKDISEWWVNERINNSMKMIEFVLGCLQRP